MRDNTTCTAEEFASTMVVPVITTFTVTQQKMIAIIRRIAI